MGLVEPKGVFYNSNEFAVLATINAVPNISVIFDAPYLEEELVEGADVVISVWDSDLPVGTENGDTVIVKSTTYLIASIQQTGQGLGDDNGSTILQLHRV